jgi:hypothetical protein
MDIGARAKKQLYRLEMSASGREGHRAVHFPSPSMHIVGLQQRRAVLVHACSQHGLDNSHVAEKGCAHKATTSPHKRKALSFRGCVASPGVLLSQALQRHPERLVHARQASQLNARQRAQHKYKHGAGQLRGHAL